MEQRSDATLITGSSLMSYTFGLIINMQPKVALCGLIWLLCLMAYPPS